MTNRVTLPAGTALGHSYEYGMDINLGTYASPAMQSIRRMSGFNPTFPETVQDASSYDDQGSANEEVTGRSFAAAFTVQGNRDLTTGKYLPELEALLAASRAKGAAALVDVQFYNKPEIGTANPTDAGRATGRVSVTRQNSGNTGVETFAVQFTGKGEYEPIANPWTGWADPVDPAIQSISPTGALSGELVTITGEGFLDASAVTFDTLPADDFTVISATTISAIVPTDTAGDVAVVVSTPAGDSPAFTYSRGA